MTTEVSDGHYAMVGYPCMNTLTDHGTVTRGICEKDENGNLTHIVEVKEIARKDGHAIYKDGEEWKPLADDTLVSMNFWGFTPAVFKDCEAIFDNFIHTEIKENPMKCEHVIPTAVGELVQNNKCTVKMLSSNDRWFGVTYKEDRETVVSEVNKLIEKGMYPSVLDS